MAMMQPIVSLIIVTRILLPIDYLMLSTTWLVIVIDIAAKLLLNEAVLARVGHGARDHELFTLRLCLEWHLLAIFSIIVASSLLKPLDLKVLGLLSDLCEVVTRVALLGTAKAIATVLAIFELSSIICSLVVTELLLVRIWRTVEAILASAASTQVLNFRLLLAILKVIFAAIPSELRLRLVVVCTVRPCSWCKVSIIPDRCLGFASTASSATAGRINRSLAILGVTELILFLVEVVTLEIVSLFGPTIVASSTS